MPKSFDYLSKLALSSTFWSDGRLMKQCSFMVMNGSLVDEMILSFPQRLLLMTSSLVLRTCTKRDECNNEP